MKRTKSARPEIKRLSRSRKMGLAPGSVVYTGFKTDRPLLIDLVQYDQKSVTETSLQSAEDCLSYAKPNLVNWFNFNGLNNVKEIEVIGLQSEMILLDIEDLVNTAQRSTLSVSDKYLKVILKLLSYGNDGELKSEHMSLVLIKDSLLIFHESDTEDFARIKERIKSTQGRIRTRGAD